MGVDESLSAGFESTYIHINTSNGGDTGVNENSSKAEITVRYLRSGALVVQLMFAMLYGWLCVYMPLNFLVIDYSNTDSVAINAFVHNFPWIMLCGLCSVVILSFIGYCMIPKSLKLSLKERPYILGEKIIGWSFALGILLITVSSVYFISFLGDTIMFVMSMSAIFVYGLSATILCSFEMNE